MQQTRTAPKVSKFKGKTKLRGGANIEGRISPRKIITQDSEGNQVQKEVDIKTANALLDVGAIVALGNNIFLDADLALSADGVSVEDYKFGEGRIDEIGLGIGKKFDDGQIGIKGTYRPDRNDATVGIGGSFKFNKGGEVQMQKQMEMFQDGGLNDQGGSKDPVSGNDVPSGSLKEEVRDDIDAKLSPGEFVFPADVVRFIGLEKLMLMRDKAKRGLARMEEMGQMGNSEEATIDDDVPFGMEDLIIVAGPPDNEMNKGGMPSYSRGGQLLGLDGYVAPTTYYNPATGQEMISTKIGGKFFPPLPKGFVEKPKKAEAKPRDVKTETAKVETELGSGERDGGPDRGDVSAGEMTMSEKADMPDFSETTKGIVGGAVGLGVGMLGMGMTQQAAKSSDMFGISQTAADLAKAGVKADFQSYDDAKAAMAAMTVEQRAAQRERDIETAVDRVQASYMDAVGANQEMRDSEIGVMGTIGGIPSPLSVDIVNEVVTDPVTKDIIGGKEAKDAIDKAKERKAKEMAETLTAQEKGFGGKTGPTSEPGALGTSPVGGRGVDAPGSGAGQGPAGGNQGSGGATGGGAASQESEYNIGGLASKPKRKKQKKMKRGGLASR